MIVAIIAVILSVALPSLWIFIPQKRIPLKKRIPKKKLIGSLLMSITVCSFLILVSEYIFDKVIGLDTTNIQNISQLLLTCFIRAALIEETFKYLFVKRAIRKIQPMDNLQYMLVAGTIGMGYGITEKIALLESGAMILNAIFPFHVFFQFIMAIFIFKAEMTPKENRKKRILFNLASIGAAMAVHGIWDVFMFATGLITDGTSGNAIIVIKPNENAGIVVFLVAILIGIVGMVFIARHLKNKEIIYLDGAPDEAVSESDSVTDTPVSDENGMHIQESEAEDNNT